MLSRPLSTLCIPKILTCMTTIMKSDPPRSRKKTSTDQDPHTGNPNAALREQKLEGFASANHSGTVPASRVLQKKEHLPIQRSACCPSAHLGCNHRTQDDISSPYQRALWFCWHIPPTPLAQGSRGLEQYQLQNVSWKGARSNVLYQAQVPVTP